MSKMLFAMMLVILLLSGCSLNRASAPEHACASCHAEAVTRMESSLHGRAGLACDACHGHLENHLEKPKIRPTVGLDANRCISCHQDEQQQWAASPHGLIDTQYYPNSLSKMQRQPHPSFPKPSYGDSEKITCVYCHNPCNPQDTKLLRLSRSQLCAACHTTLWQNQVLAGKPAHPYPDKEYTQFANHPHNSGGRCITCLMARTATSGAGGHSLAMRVPETGELHLAACAPCHANLDSFDINEIQTEAGRSLATLRAALEARNNGALPPSTAGTCNQCKKGGFEPFNHDPELVLEHAFQNYIQLEMDRSLGVHQPKFTLEILRQSLESVESEYKQ